HSNDVHDRRACRKVLADTRPLLLHDAVQRRNHRSVFQLLSCERDFGSSLGKYSLAIANLFVSVLITTLRNFERRSRGVEFGFCYHALLDESSRTIAVVTSFIEHRARLAHSRSLLGIDAVVGAIRRQAETCSSLRQRSFRLLHTQAIVFRINLCDYLSLRDDTAEVNRDCADASRHFDANCRLIKSGERAVCGDGLAKGSFSN